MRRLRFICLASALLYCRAALALTNPYGAYLWSIPSEQISVSRGSAITDAAITLKNLSCNTPLAGKTLTLYLLRNGPAGCMKIPVNNNENPFENFGTKFAVIQAEYISNPCAELKIRLSRSNDPGSRLWKIFQYPLVLALPDSSNITLSSSILEINDILGSSRSLSVGILSNGICFDSATLELTARSYADSKPIQTIQHTWQSSQPPVFEPVANKTVSELDRLSFAVRATDPFGQPVSITASNLPTGASFSNGLFSWQPALGSAGAYTVRFAASDAQSQTFMDVVITVQRLKFTF